MCVWAFKISDIQCLMTLQTSPFRIVIHIDIQQDTPLFTRKKITGEAPMNYNWTPVYTPFEPFKNMKNRSKWLDLLRRFGLNWLPQSVSFGSEMVRNYYELQERDMEPYQLQTFRSLSTANSYGIETLQCAGILPKTFI